MNITFLIGNGFDINLDLKTRYTDFYQYYVRQSAENESDAIKIFKLEITDFIKRDTNKKNDDSIDWRDLELALGKWTSNLNPEEVEPLYLNIIDSLRDYLIDEFKFFDASAFSKSRFLNYFLDPVDNFFSRNLRTEIRNFWNNKTGLDQISIINFNYTKTIERLINFQGAGISLGGNLIGRSTVLNNIYHIHQSIDDDEVLVGLNDVSQIANKDLHKNKHICDLLIKPNTNILLGEGIDRDCEELIANTHLFIIFGTSVGITDRKWWNAICQRVLRSDARIIYYVHYPYNDPHMRIHYVQMKEKYVSLFLDSAGVKKEDVLDSILPKMYICFKPGMFMLEAEYNNNIPDNQTYKLGKNEVEIQVLEKRMKSIALSVNAPDEKSGVLAEKKWIKDYFPDFHNSLQTLRYYSVDDRQIPYDYFLLESDNSRKELYFDISSFYGKYDDYEVMSISNDKRLSAFLKEIDQRDRFTSDSRSDNT